ncbi:MAG: cytochrome c [Chromatiales bacterium]|nr:cytochrome c [Chromatiales bacterium]
MSALATANLATSLAHSSDVDAGERKARVCAGCHGVDGNSVNSQWPKLAGQHEAYLVKSMRAYRSGSRRDPVMGAMTKPLTDADIDNLAA